MKSRMKETKSKYNECGKANHQEQIVKNDIYRQRRNHYWHCDKDTITTVESATILKHTEGCENAHSDSTK
jgi:hypothetical protein